MKVKLICDIHNQVYTEVEEERYKVLIENESNNYIGKDLYAKIDRPYGCKPYKDQPDYYYKLNYGYIPGTISGDGEELDCYILGIDKPLEDFEGECIAVVHRINEDDDKLIIAPKGENYSKNQIEEATYFSEQYHKSFVYMK